MNDLVAVAERDSAALLPVQLEGSLFQALDSEADVGIAGHIKATLRTLLRAGAPEQPSRWLAMCSDVVLATTSLSQVTLRQLTLHSLDVSRCW